MRGGLLHSRKKLRFLRGLFASLFLLQLTLAAAADHEQSVGPAVREYVVTGEQVDRVHFAVTGVATTRLRIVVKGLRRTIGCATRYCRSPGTQQAVIRSVVLHRPTSTTPVANSATVNLAAGNYLLEIIATGIGTGRYRGEGVYSVRLFPIHAKRQTTDDD